MTWKRPYKIFSMLDDYRNCLFDDTKIALWLPNLQCQVFAIISELILFILTWDFSHSFSPSSNFGSHHEDFLEIARSTQVRKSSPFGRIISWVFTVVKGHQESFEIDIFLKTTMSFSYIFDERFDWTFLFWKTAKKIQLKNFHVF